MSLSSRMLFAGDLLGVIAAMIVAAFRVKPAPTGQGLANGIPRLGGTTAELIRIDGSLPVKSFEFALPNLRGCEQVFSFTRKQETAAAIDTSARRI